MSTTSRFSDAAGRLHSAPQAVFFAAAPARRPNELFCRSHNMPPKRPMLDPTTIPVSEREGNQLAWSMKEFEHYGDVTTKTPCRFCGFEFKGSVADFEDFDYDVLPWDIEMVIAEPDACCR